MNELGTVQSIYLNESAASFPKEDKTDYFSLLADEVMLVWFSFIDDVTALKILPRLSKRFEQLANDPRFDRAIRMLSCAPQHVLQVKDFHSGIACMAYSPQSHFLVFQPHLDIKQERTSSGNLNFYNAATLKQQTISVGKIFKLYMEENEIYAFGWSGIYRFNWDGHSKPVLKQKTVQKYEWNGCSEVTGKGQVVLSSSHYNQGRYYYYDIYDKDFFQTRHTSIDKSLKNFGIGRGLVFFHEEDYEHPPGDTHSHSEDAQFLKGGDSAELSYRTCIKVISLLEGKLLYQIPLYEGTTFSYEYTHFTLAYKNTYSVIEINDGKRTDFSRKGPPKNYLFPPLFKAGNGNMLLMPDTKGKTDDALEIWKAKNNEMHFLNCFWEEHVDEDSIDFLTPARSILFENSDIHHTFLVFSSLVGQITIYDPHLPLKEKDPSSLLFPIVEDSEDENPITQTVPLEVSEDSSLEGDAPGDITHLTSPTGPLEGDNDPDGVPSSAATTESWYSCFSDCLYRLWEALKQCLFS